MVTKGWRPRAMQVSSPSATLNPVKNWEFALQDVSLWIVIMFIQCNLFDSYKDLLTHKNI